MHMLWVLPCTRCVEIPALQQVGHFKHFNVNGAVYKNLFPSLPRGTSHMFHTVQNAVFIPTATLERHKPGLNPVSAKCKVEKCYQAAGQCFNSMEDVTVST